MSMSLSTVCMHRRECVGEARHYSGCSGEAMQPSGGRYGATPRSRGPTAGERGCARSLRTRGARRAPTRSTVSARLSPWPRELLVDHTSIRSTRAGDKWGVGVGAGAGAKEEEAIRIN